MDKRDDTKKRKTKKLRLSVETLQSLTDRELDKVTGGAYTQDNVSTDFQCSSG
jgi:hypothetical protein